VDVDTVSLFLALLAVVAEVLAVVALSLLVAWATDMAPARTDWGLTHVGPAGLGLAAQIAVVAMLGSLYFSEVANFTPCTLCWYQRICMYALAIVLTIAAVRRDRSITPYAMVLAGLGAVISTYHVLVERFPSLESDVCDPANPCTLIWVKRLGYLTIPTMALSGFVAILVLLTLDRTAAKAAGPDAKV
jgi:disulfide bond formation protein DsbB